MTAPRVLLASGSPRRRKLLEAAGFAVEVKEPKIDDGAVHVHESVPARLVISLAWFKASQVAVVPINVVALVAADTVCDVEGVVLGKPADRAAAAAMLASMFDSSHTTRTGVCVRSAEGRLLFEDASIVRMGRPTPEDLERYLDSEEWMGKAGGYNLADRLQAGWPIECEGDPTTVMGLPMARLGPLLHELAGRHG